MIESLAEHGVLATDLVPSLMTTHTVANPEYDPAEEKRRAEEKVPDYPGEDDLDTVVDEEQVDEHFIPPTPTIPLPSSVHTRTTSGNIVIQPQTPSAPTPGTPITPGHVGRGSSNLVMQPVTTKVLGESSVAPDAMAGVTTTLSAADKDVTLDIRWTVLCDLFLIIIANSVYDARSRVLLENVAGKLGLGWLDIVKFESRVTEALEIQEGIEKLESQDVIDERNKAGRRKRYMMMGLATLGEFFDSGYIYLFSNVLHLPRWRPCYWTICRITRTCHRCWSWSSFHHHWGRRHYWIPCWNRRCRHHHYRRCPDRFWHSCPRNGQPYATSENIRHSTASQQQASQLHSYSSRVGRYLVSLQRLFITTHSFRCLTGVNDDVRLPFSVLDPIVGDVFSVLWEPEMLRETGSALKILSAEVLSQISQTVLQATVMTALMSALQWPISVSFFSLPVTIQL